MEQTSSITMMVSKQPLETVRQRLHTDAGRLREERWAVLLSSVATDVLDVVVLPARTAGSGSACENDGSDGTTSPGTTEHH